MKRGDFVPGLLALLLILGLAGCSGKAKENAEASAPPAGQEQTAGEQAASSQTKFDGLIIHFKRPADWGEPRIYLFEQAGARTEEYAGGWPGSPMTPEGNGWYVYSAAGIPVAKIIFNDGNNQIPKPLWPQFGFEKQQGEWWYDGSWHVTNPDPPASPTPPPA